MIETSYTSPTPANGNSMLVSFYKYAPNLVMLHARPEPGAAAQIIGAFQGIKDGCAIHDLHRVMVLQAFPYVDGEANLDGESRWAASIRIEDGPEAGAVRTVLYGDLYEVSI